MRIYANDGVPHEVAPRSYVRWKNSMKSAKVVGKTTENLQKSLEKCIFSPELIVLMKQKLSYIMVVDDLYLFHIDGPVAILMFVVPFVSGIVE